MDRNDSNPGMVERQLDDAPMQGSSREREDGVQSDRGLGMERELLQGEGLEREGMQGEGRERDSLRGDGLNREPMQGEGVERESMEGSERRGGYGDDTPSGNTPQRDW
jgi:hypothetical protein